MKIDIRQVLTSSEIFSVLPAEAIDSILAETEVIQLAPAQTLFSKGDSADAMYVVLHGSLVVLLYDEDGQEKIISTIKCGQTVGDIGILTGQPRIATIKAFRQTDLIRLSRACFEKYLLNSPEALVRLYRLLVKRAEKTVKFLTNKYHCTNIILVPAKPNINIRDFVEHFRPAAPKQFKITFVNMSTFENENRDRSWLSEYLHSLEMDNDFVIYIMDTTNRKVIEIFLGFVERVVIIGAGNGGGSIHTEIKKELASYQSKFVKKDLVLLHPPGIKPSNTSSWISDNLFHHFYHVRMDHQEDYARVFRYLTGTATGLVLSGGAGRGWIEIGALKALNSAKVEIDAIGGTSIGAGIAAYLLTNADDTEFEGLIRHSKKLHTQVSFRNITLPIISIFNGKQVTDLAHDLYSEYQIEDLIKPFFCVSCNANCNCETVHRQGSLALWIRASCSPPGLIPPVSYQGQLYTDGGVLNNFPTDVMKNYFEGNGKIIGVNISDIKIDRNVYHVPEVITIWKSIALKLGFGKHNQYIFPNFSELFFRELLMGSCNRILNNMKLADILVNPDISKYGFVTDLQTVPDLIQLGYDTMMSKLNNN